MVSLEQSEFQCTAFLHDSNPPFFFNIYILYILLTGIQGIDSGTKKAPPQILKYLSFLVFGRLKGTLGTLGYRYLRQSHGWQSHQLTSSASVYQGPRLGGHGDNIGTLEHVYWQTSELSQSLTTGNITRVLSQGKEGVGLRSGCLWVQMARALLEAWRIGCIL